MRALGTPDSAGGYTIPEDFYNKLTDALKFYGGMRQSRAEIIRSTSGADLPMPTDDDTSNSGAILDENTQVGEQDITFGVVILGAYMYTSKLVRVSLQLLQDSAFDLESWLARKLGERIGRATNNHFTVGTGTAQPNGVVTAASEGKVGDTGQTTSVTYGDLVDLFHAVDRDYRQNGEWMMHDSSLKALKKLEDNDGRPLWQPGLAVREPDTILGKPYIVNNDVPVMGVDAKSILFGDFSLYKIRDVLGVQVLRLQERYADFLQVGFLAFSRHDGDLLDAGTAPIKYYQNSST
jgi:HK97 family phage major capsid protein